MDIYRIATGPLVRFMLLFLSCTNAFAQTQTTTLGNGKEPILVRKVFVNVTGDPKLAHRLMTFIGLELEDANFLSVTTEADADAEIDARVELDVSTPNLVMGLIKLATTADGKTNISTSCASMSTAEDGEFFDSSAESVANGLRKKYPNAKKVKVDPLSDLSASKRFGLELPNSLKTSGLEIVRSGQADISIRLDLVRVKVPLEERVVRYKSVITLRDGSQPSSSQGSGVLSARALSQPEFCPERVQNLDWLANGRFVVPRVSVFGQGTENNAQDG